MGTYISIPYVTRRSVHVEQSKPVTVQTTKVDSIPEEEPKVEEPKVEVKQELKEEQKEEAKNVIVEAEEVIPELLPKQLSISIPSESEAVANFSEKVIVPPRIPEFQGNMNSESHAIKKFNRRHRKHLQN
jgi:hypothetical protein